jgi:cation:H+ antiporter
LAWPLHVSIPVFTSGALLILWSGSRLPIHGEGVAARAGIGATTLGLFVLAVITSLPELAVTFTAMLGVGAPELAFANVLGSNNFNVAVIALLPAGVAGLPILARVDRARYARTCRLLIVLSLIAGIGAWFGRLMPPGLSAVVFSLLIVGLFLWDLAGGRRGLAPPAPDLQAASDPHVVTKFVLHAAVVVGAGILVALSGKQIAEHEFAAGARVIVLGQTFVGTILVAVATSLPEVTVAVSAVRRTGAADVAVGTLLGSNSFNLAIFALGAPFLMFGGHNSGWSELSSASMINVATAVVLTLVVLAGMRATALDARRRAARAATAVLIPIYLLGLFFVHRAGGG